MSMTEAQLQTLMAAAGRWQTELVSEVIPAGEQWGDYVGNWHEEVAEISSALMAAAEHLLTLKPVEDPDDLVRFWYGRREVSSGSYANEPCDWTIYAQSRAGDWYIGHVATLAWTDSWVPCGAPKHRLGNELKPQA